MLEIRQPWLDKGKVRRTRELKQKKNTTEAFQYYAKKRLTDKTAKICTPKNKGRRQSKKHEKQMVSTTRDRRKNLGRKKPEDARLPQGHSTDWMKRIQDPLHPAQEGI